MQPKDRLGKQMKSFTEWLKTIKKSPVSRVAVSDVNLDQTVEKLAKDLDRTFYLTPEQAKEYGLIDKVLESSKQLPQPLGALR